MAYTDKFKPADDLFSTFSSSINNFNDDLKSKITGFLTVSAVTCYELAVKDILIDFATSRHVEFGNFMMNHLKRINGNIKIKDLKDLINNFGDHYKSDYEDQLKSCEQLLPPPQRFSMRDNYNSLILCRHSFVHANNVTLSFQECRDYYAIGKNIIKALSQTLTA